MAVLRSPHPDFELPAAFTGILETHGDESFDHFAKVLHVVEVLSLLAECCV
jgi:hypothetical protein